MTIWEQITKNLRANKGQFTGTSGKDLTKELLRTEKGKNTYITSPTSYRTITNNGDEEIGLTSGEAKEVASTAIKDIEYDPSSENAKIRYVGGDKQYDFPMTPDEYKAFLTAPSKGRWVAYDARRYI